MAFDGLKSQEQLYDWAQINAGDTGLLIVAGEVVLHSLVVNAVAASGTVVLHDAATVAAADTGNEVANVDVTAIREALYDIVFSSGIVAKPGLGDTQGDITLTFRSL